MNMARLVAVVLVSFGLAGVSMALGFIYMDFVRREGAWVDINSRRGDLTEDDRERILAAWEDPGRGWPAFAAGTAGVAMLGAGLMIGVFELPLFQRRSASQVSG